MTQANIIQELRSCFIHFLTDSNWNSQHDELEEQGLEIN